MARTITAVTVAHQSPDAAGFELDIAAAEAHALATGLSRTQILDRMDAIDPYTLPATDPLLSGSVAARTQGRSRARTVLATRGVPCHVSEVPADSVAHELSIVHSSSNASPLVA